MSLLHKLAKAFAFLLLQFARVSSQTEDICTEELDLLADSVSNFTRCAVNQASPFRFCHMCYDEFDTVRFVKSAVYDKHYDCVKELVESERYQIVKRVYDFANNLWEGSFCYNTHIVCTKCYQEYSDLNEAYGVLIFDMGGYVKENILCADVVSAMNATRQRWSHDFNCVQHDLDTVAVVAMTVLFCFFPIVFYSAARLHGTYTDKRKNRHIPRIDYNSTD